MNTSYDIAIIGAGPAGCAAALTLRDSGFSVALFEKAQFPRQKICGDGVCDRSINILKTLSPSYLEEFLSKEDSLCIRNTELTYKGHSYFINFNSFGYTCKRYDFDRFLFSLVTRDCNNCTIYQNTEIRSVYRENERFNLTSNDNETYSAKMLLVCNGACSKIARELTGKKFSKRNLGVAVRAYYKGVQGLRTDTLELHYKKEYFPGYLWIFPMADGSANVGFGRTVSHENETDQSIREQFNEWIKNDETLKERFKSAELITPIQGGLIPYNDNLFDCYGEGFLLCGDAANLIDPISGGGIGSAMLSGHYAALQAKNCFKSNTFTVEETEKYAKNLKKRMGEETNIRLTLQQTISKHRWLLDVLAFIGRRAKMLDKIKTWYLDK